MPTIHLPNEPGEYVEAMVAERVMGWTFEEDGGYWIVPGSGESYADRPPPWSRQTEAAYGVIAFVGTLRLDAQRAFFRALEREIRLDADARQPEPEPEDLDAEDAIEAGFADEPEPLPEWPLLLYHARPLAICRAALLVAARAAEDPGGDLSAVGAITGADE